MSSKAAKTPPKKPARKASSARVKSALKKETVASLAKNLKSLETRLKGADTKNRNAIKALETVIADIKTSMHQGTITQKAALTRGLNQLEIRMETYLQRAAAQAKVDVKTELARVTSAGAGLSTLESAVQAAHDRLDAMDSLQRESLARLNRHIADLATSVENRISSESQARKADSAALEAKINAVHEHVEKRVDRVETDTAQALQIVGIKVAEFAAVLEKRAETSDAETAERLADLAQETQTDFKTAQTNITARLEALEVIASAWSPAEPQVMANPYLPANADDPRIDQMGDMIQSLQDELSRMHARIATVQNSETPSGSPANIQAAAHNILPIPVVNAPIEENPYAAAVAAIGASTGQASAPIPPAPAPQAKPKAASPQRSDSHIPEEFDPSAYIAPNAPADASMPLPIAAPPVTHVPPVDIPPMAPPMASQGAYAPTPAAAPAQADPNYPPIDLGHEPLIPAPQPVSTYADPAYAEDSDMRAKRIIGETKKRKSLPKLQISGRNLRVGALAAGVAVAGLFAAKTILGGPNSGGAEIASNDIQNIAPAPEAERLGVNNMSVSASADTPPPPTQPIGQYAETATPTFVEAQEGSLDAAVAAGNPIAQFQKGLAQLQTGQMEEGARLIRLSANRNQPAAQYRLAKLYETGTGVAKDPITARELIERAARGGNRIAMHDLGNYHAYGQGGLTADIGEAMKWFTKAAERGVVDSQFNVAFLSEGNEGVPADLDTALFWYHVAARQGDQGAPERIQVLKTQLDAAAQAQIQSRADQFNPKPVDEAANGIFRDVAWARPAATSEKAKSADIIKIRDAQTLLTELGYQLGAPDGIAGAKTRDAVKSFEAVNGLPQTGEITDALLEKLEMASGA
jgi:localization factor PodJL